MTLPPPGTMVWCDVCKVEIPVDLLEDGHGCGRRDCPNDEHRCKVWPYQGEPEEDIKF